MMGDGRVVFDLGGEERHSMTVSQLLDRFKTAASKNLEDDRMLLS